MSAALFALRVTATAAGFGVVWVLGFASSLAVLAMWEAQVRKRGASESRFRELFDDAPIAYHELDHLGIIRRVNRAECALLGYEEHELLGRPVWDFITASDKDAARRTIGRTLAGEQSPQPLRRGYSRRDGSELALEIHSTLVRNRHGAIVGLRAALVDITDRLRAEAAAQEAHELLHGVLNSVPVRIFWKDRNLAYMGCNGPFARDAGFEKPEDVVGKDDYAMSWREQAELYRADDRAVIESGIARLLFDERQTTPSGERMDLLTSKLPLRDAGGFIVGVIGVYYDITERKRTEEALRESEERLRTILRTAMDGFWLLDKQGRLLEVNEAYCRMSGYSAKELLAMRVSDLVSNEAAADAATRIKRIVEQGEDRFESRHRRKDGSVFDVEVNVQYLPVEGGRFVGFLQDITQRKATAEALLQRSGELARSNTELERELATRRRAEEELRRKEYSLSESQRIAHVGSWRWELPMGVTACVWTPETYRIFGVSPDTFVPSVEAFQNLIHPDDRAAMQAWTGACLAGEEPPDLEFRVGPRDGDIRYVLGRGHLVRDEKNEPVRLVGIAQDITERRWVEEEVRQAHEKLSTSVRILETRAVRDRLLSEMRAFLQACSSTQEIAPVIAHAMRTLFPESDGALFLLSPSKTDLDTAVRWGNFPEERDENLFSPDTCWGLRRGCLHVVDDCKNGLICPHMRHLAATEYACLPLTANSEVLGLLHLRGRPESQPAAVREMLAALEDISPMLSELLSLSISNLRLSETLRMQSTKDPLTGLFNRRYMEECLQREIWRASRNERPIGVVMADIDRFKEFNDVYGHAAGDYVLSAFGSLVNIQIRGSDIPCRLGGDEFSIILPEATPEDAARRADELREGVTSLRLTYDGHELGPVTISMGVSGYPDGGSNVEELLKSADAALYRAKLAGRNRVAVQGQSVFAPESSGVDWRAAAQKEA